MATGSEVADGEDEEAFMDCLAALQPAQGDFMPAVLKLRSAPVEAAGCGSAEWSEPIMLLEGAHAAGRAPC